jgi:hypothetical protein
MTGIAGAALIVAVVAAVRSTWSPCGVSMLSSITPMGERARGNRYGTTVSWFVLGSVLGGLSLGLIGAGGAVLVRAIQPSEGTAWVVALLAAAVTLASDLRIGGLRLPAHPRQVDRRWLDLYRSWVYGLGFGWQLGVGVSTYVMTSAIYLMVVLAALTGEPLVALAVVGGFGIIRGFSILLGAGATTPHNLSTLHQRIERLRPVSRFMAVGFQAAFVSVVAGWLAGPAVGLAAAAIVGAVVWSKRRDLRDPRPHPDQPPVRRKPRFSVEPATGR